MTAGDEAMDLNPMCGKSFHCVNSDVCIEQSQVCNFHTDCPLGEDEGLICGERHFLILYTSTAFTRLILRVSKQNKDPHLNQRCPNCRLGATCGPWTDSFVASNYNSKITEIQLPSKGV